MHKGLFVNLRRADTSDFNKIMEWMSSPDYSNNILDYSNVPPDDLRIFMLNRLNNVDKYPSYLYFIVETKKGAPIGIATLNNINWKDRNLSLELIIGDDKFRGKMYGIDICITASDVAFSVLNMYKLWSYIYSFNEQSIKMCKWLGVPQEAILKDQKLSDGKLFDTYVFGMLKPDFYKLKTAKQKQLLEASKKKSQQ